MLVVLALAAVAVIVGVTVVAMGRGGELSEFAPDVPPLDLPKGGQLGAVDFMALQLPVSLVGYHTQSVDEALNRVAGALSERDTRIAVLEQRVSELLAGRLQARHELKGGLPAALRELEAPYELSGHGRSAAGEERSAVSHVEGEVPYRLPDVAEPVVGAERSAGAPVVPRAEHGAGGADELSEANELPGADGVQTAEKPSEPEKSPDASEARFPAEVSPVPSSGGVDADLGEPARKPGERAREEEPR